ncbi:hypothetical protein EDC02_5688 [Micromonospora sp. Llam0]|uniref:hypothetical protein n=1 Tax=Micromonospora sp. Llam0 TaxID=2485143 RepID=UPI000F4A4436|nr:hypothetical protein [Micromonospora sp. Llam0]ROO50829.1 hypothetical protein EDC02_5688 [Micromonospora sp. Llam0]
MLSYETSTLSTLTAACAPTVGGYLAAVAPIGHSAGANQVQTQTQIQVEQTHQRQLAVPTTVPAGATGQHRTVVTGWVGVDQGWVRLQGASVVVTTNGTSSSEGSVRTTIPAAKKPFMDAARGVPPRGRPV